MLSRNIYSKIRIPKATPDAVRLCSIVSELDPPTIWCNLQTIELKKAPEYAALSYAWRAPVLRTYLDDTLHTINCNGDELLVHDNLFHALLRLGQSPYRGSFFWIDAICIDQDNTEERNYQVSLMADIYKNAKQVILWLGPDDEYAAQATRLVRKLHALSEVERRAILPYNLESTANKQILQPDLWERSHWIALAQFLRRTWFSRAWVIQEVLLAASVRVLCGREHVLAWEQLGTVSHFLSTTAWRRTFTDPQWLGFYDVMPLYNSPANLRAAKAELTNGNALLLSLIRSRMHDCSEQIDKVFCLYGIASLHTPEGVTVPKADYRLSVAQAYTDTAINVLRSSEDLHMLAYSEGPIFRNVRGLPSWAPDWSVKQRVGIGVTGHKRYWAAGDMPKTELRFPEPGILRPNAAHVCDIVACGESKREVSITKSLDRCLRLLDNLGVRYCTGEPIMEAFWRTLLYDTGDDGKYPARREFSDSFPTWFSDYLVADSAAIAKYANLTQRMQPSDTSESQASVEYRASQKHVFDHCFHLRVLLRMFKTDNGLLGLGTECLEPGDSVWIVPGSRIPLAFRKTAFPPSADGPDRYELVGCAYLHGFMHGQALDPGVPDNGRRRPLLNEFKLVDLQ